MGKLTKKLLLLMNQASFNPWALTNNAALYSLRGAPSPSTYMLNGNSNQVTLIADRSGNSAVNGLVLNGVASNNASTPNSSPLQITGDIDIQILLSSTNWTSDQVVISKDGGTGGANTRSYEIDIDSSGKLAFFFSINGSTGINVLSTSATGFANYSKNWIRVTRVAATGVITFYTGNDGVNWTQLGTTITSTTGSLAASTVSLILGQEGVFSSSLLIGVIYRAQIYSGINGTLVFDANFQTSPKLAASFVESSSNAATVTINTSGDTGARISGARDLVQLTTAKMPIWSTIGGLNLVTFNGINQYMKSATFNLNQPESVYVIANQIAWSAGTYLYDGNTTTSCALIQNPSSPSLRISAGTNAADNSGLIVGNRGVITAQFNGTSSFLQINKQASTTGNSGATNSQGFTIGSSAAPANFSNIAFSEAILRSSADSVGLQLQIISVLMRYYRIYA